MENDQQNIDKLVDRLFRAEAGKLVAMLTRLFGVANLQLAEDIVQDTLLTALNHWSVGEIPDNPAAWITLVAKRKAINELNRNKSALKYAGHLKIIQEPNTQLVDDIFLDKEIRDSQLRMIFTCCHPALPVESQIALTLKTLCGFGIHEIAKALFSNVSNINKRLYRAKQKFRTGRIPFDIPSGNELENRLETVCLTLYLLFNEGYNSSHPSSIIRKDLCMEAIRLTQLLAGHFGHHSNLFALLALMCFHAARFDSRIDDKGAIIIFEDQDRKLWNRQLIIKGAQYLTKASGGNQLTAYHLEAAIAAEHCLAKNFEETDWQSIYKQYLLLYEIRKSPVILLNLAIIESKINSIEISLKKLKEIEKSKALDGYYLLPVTQGILSMKINEYKDAIAFLTKAKRLTQSQQEIEFITKQLQICKGQD